MNVVTVIVLLTTRVASTLNGDVSDALIDLFDENLQRGDRVSGGKISGSVIASGRRGRIDVDVVLDEILSRVFKDAREAFEVVARRTKGDNLGRALQVLSLLVVCNGD